MLNRSSKRKFKLFRLLCYSPYLDHVNSLVLKFIGTNIKFSKTLQATVLSAFLSCACYAQNISPMLSPFTTDGCSAFPDGTIKIKDQWLSCCIAHDLAYWQGGTYKERVLADEELKRCVNQVSNPVLAELMKAGVRVGGSPYFPSSFRWGYGWPYPRGYQALTAEEKILVNQMISQIPENIDIED